MITRTSIAALILVSAVFTHQLQAQGVSPKGKKSEQIVVLKKGRANEKVTVVIEGGEVTVNGKPVTDFSSDSIDVRVFKGDLSRGFQWHDNSGNIGLPNNAFLGVTTENAEKGVLIQEVRQESAAEKAGLQKGDIITSLNDSAITSSDHLYNAVRKHKSGDQVTIAYLRNGMASTVQATLGASPLQRFRLNNRFPLKDMPSLNALPVAPDLYTPFAGFSRQPRLGLQIQDMEDSKGVKVLEAAENSPAAKAGLQKNDIITGVNGHGVTSVDDVRSQLHDIKEGDMVKIDVQRNDKRQTVEIKFPKKLKTTHL